MHLWYDSLPATTPRTSHRGSHESFPKWACLLADIARSRTVVAHTSAITSCLPSKSRQGHEQAKAVTQHQQPRQRFFTRERNSRSSAIRILPLPRPHNTPHE